MCVRKCYYNSFLNTIRNNPKIYYLTNKSITYIDFIKCININILYFNSKYLHRQNISTSAPRREIERALSTRKCQRFEYTTRV